MLKFSIETQRLALITIILLCCSVGSSVFAQNAIVVDMPENERKNIDQMDFSSDWFTSALQEKVTFDAELIGTDFGMVSRNSTRFYSVTNHSDSTVTIANITSTNSQFVINGFSPDTELLAGDILNFEVDFTPEMDGIQFSNITVFSDDTQQIPHTFTVQAFGDIVVLPGEYLTLLTQPTDANTVKLTWEAIYQISSKKFILQRSIDDVIFEDVATVEAQPLEQVLATYEYIDEHPLPGSTYYRLRQVDMGGKSAYSVSRIAVVQDLKPEIATQNLEVDSSATKPSNLLSSVEVQIYSTTGKLVYQNTTADNELPQVSFPTLNFLRKKNYSVELPVADRTVEIMSLVKSK